MKPAPYFVALLLAVTCLVLSIALMVLGTSNQRFHLRLQAEQQTLNKGVLGQQGKQISANLLRDLAAAAPDNPRIRSLLQEHGYEISPSAAAAPAPAEPQDGKIESSTTDEDPAE
jgi:hypothetical protein